MRCEEEQRKFPSKAQSGRKNHTPGTALLRLMDTKEGRSRLHGESVVAVASAGLLSAVPSQQSTMTHSPRTMGSRAHDGNTRP